MVSPGEERAYLAAGSSDAAIASSKRLTDDAPALPKTRDAWRLAWHLDFF
jgi:hypothetical protein